MKGFKNSWIVTEKGLEKTSLVYDELFTEIGTEHEELEQLPEDYVVVPGFMATAMSSTLTDEQRGKIYARTSLKAATSIRSVAETVAFLLGEKAESITGQNIHVDNGTI